MPVTWITEDDERHREDCAFVVALTDLRNKKKDMTPIKWAQARLALDVKCNCK